MTSRSPSPLTAAPVPHPAGAGAAAGPEKESSHSAASTSPSSGSNTPAPAQTAQPANNTELNNTNNVTSQNPRWPPNDRQPAQTSSRVVHIPRATGTFSNGSLSVSTSRSPSTTATPHSSRDSSPAGRLFRQQSVPGPSSSSGMRNSHEVSPHRPPSITGHTSSVPSAAAIQRALSAATTPQLPPAPTSEPASRVPRPARGGATSSTPSESNTPSWPISPRLKSPPPSGSRRNSLRTQMRSDAGAPNIVIQSATPTTSTEALPLIEQELEQELRQPAPLAKTSARGASGAPTLETVQETSGPTTPGNDSNALSSNDINQKYFDMPEEKVPWESTTPRRSMAPAANKSTKASNSDSDGGEKKGETNKAQDNDPDTTPRPKAPSARASFSSLRQQKTGAEPATRSMTVETETVNSVAQSTIGAPSDRVSSRAEHGGTLRTKASNDTIKPSKSRKKASRKAPSITAAGGSTRADIFEDRVKNAMDEETSDDSDETFVYESNPAEPPIRRSRHHSRTPSGASLMSIGGQRDARQVQGLPNTQKTRSMKFANAYNSADDDAMERIDGTIRGSNPSNRGSTVHHHHTGRPSWSTTGHASILDDDSPFPQLNKVRSLTGLPGRQTQNARIAARNLQASNWNGNGNGHGNGNGLARKDNGYMSYDLDAEGGDDERTPLIANTGTLRTPRSLRRPPTRGSRTERYPRRRQGMLTRFAGCVAIMAMLFLLVFGIVGFLFIITTPLTHVQIYEIQSPLASESEIMFDLKIGAVNPNLLPISIADVDFNIFAKSKFVGTEKWWREHPDGDWADEPLPPRKMSPIEARRKRAATIDVQENFIPQIPGTFPDDDDAGNGSDTKQTMLLGRVFHFDNPLNFDASFLKRHVHNSTGAIRLQQPGNHTELGGSERWERVVLHEFDLIVRGTLKYTIPLGGKAYATNVGARVTVDPQKDDSPGPGEGKDPKNGDKKKDPTKSKAVASHGQQRWKFTIHPFEEEDSVRERLRRRVFARLLRML